jgi:hypothetical protein
MPTATAPTNTPIFTALESAPLPVELGDAADPDPDAVEEVEAEPFEVVESTFSSSAAPMPVEFLHTSLPRATALEENVMSAHCRKH